MAREPRVPFFRVGGGSAGVGYCWFGDNQIGEMMGLLNEAIPLMEDEHSSVEIVLCYRKKSSVKGPPSKRESLMRLGLAEPED